MKKFAHIIALLLICTGATLAQMNQHLKEEFHDAEAYGIHVLERLSGLRSALMKEDMRVLCFQSFGEEIDDEAMTELLDWVRDGNTVWFYDARLAPKFGMRPMYITKEQFRTKPESGQLGGKKRGGLATTVVSYGSHAVQTGVGQVTVFLPEIEQETEEGEKEKVYGVVEKTADTMALLQFTLDSPAVIACRREGKGFIVFKSLLWSEPLSGERFQSNLLEYSAGYQVPGPAGVGKVGNPPGPEAEYVEGEPAEPIAAGNPMTQTDPGHPQPPVENGTDTNTNTNTVSTNTSGAAEKTAGPWQIELKDGTTVNGEIDLQLVEFETGTSSLKLEPLQIKSIEMGSSVKLDKIVTDKGKESSGLLITSPLKFRTERGVEEFEKEDIVKVVRE